MQLNFEIKIEELKSIVSSVLDVSGFTASAIATVSPIRTQVTNTVGDSLVENWRSITLVQGFSRGGSQTSSISVTWELINILIIELHPDLKQSEILGGGLSSLPSKWFWCPLKFENHCYSLNCKTTYNFYIYFNFSSCHYTCPLSPFPFPHLLTCFSFYFSVLFLLYSLEEIPIFTLLEVFYYVGAMTILQMYTEL